VTEDQKKKQNPVEEETSRKAEEKIVETASVEEVDPSKDAPIEEVEAEIPAENTEEVEVVEDLEVSFNSPFIIGKKVGMTRIFDDNGRDFPATIVEAGPCFITQVKTKENDGYSAVQLGFGSIAASKLSKPENGHLAKAGTEGLRHLQEYRSNADIDVLVGGEINVSIFELGDLVTAIGTSKGRGFTGHMKRHNFSGGRRSHGKNSVMRKAGSIGAGSDPSRVWPGTRMAGRSGNERVSVKNLEVIRIDQANNLVFLRGAVPGAKNGILYLTK